MSTIWEEVLHGNIAAVLSLLDDGVGVDERNWLGETPLLICARHGLEEMASALLNAGASVHVKDWESGWTPLHRSLYFGHIRLSLLLLQAGALMDGGRDLDSPGRGERRKHRARSHSRSESLAAPAEVKNRSGRQRNDDLGDGEGDSPLDVLSLELRPQLKAARDSGLGGDVFSFGKADFTLGYPTSFGRADVVRPRRIEALANLQVTRVSASKYHSAAVTKCGRLYTWGHGKSGRLGHGDEITCMLPTRVEGLAHQTVTEVATAESHTVALTSSGAVFSWGRDRFGQLGHGSGSNGRHAPKRVESLKKFTVVGVATGTEHTAVVTRSGNCYTFGRNSHGQLGLAGVKETRSPRVVSGLSNGASRGAGGVGRHVIKVSASARSTMVITRGVDRGSGLHPVNEVFSWGLGSHVPSRINFNSDRGTASSSSRWQTHDARIDIVDIAAARCHNIAIDRIGRVFSWGFGADNLGLQPREARTERGPQLVAGLLPFNCGGNPVRISASDQHSCVVTDSGDLYTWGTCDEEGGALGHSHERWQPVAKRVPLLKKVVSVAAAPDHTVVLCAASCPSLPHGASFASANPRSEAHQADDRAIDEEADEDAEVDVDSEEEADGLSLANSAGRFEPLTLKQACEAKLAQEVDLHNAGALLAYADALDAPTLVRFCAEFVRRNLDGILVMGRESDRGCLLEACASGAVASALECGARRKAPTRPASAAKGASPSPVPDDEAEEGLDPELQATALARAEMRSKTPSAKDAARAVRSLKKKIARIREWEQARERGEELSSEKVSKVSRRSRMEDDLTSLESQLERAKLAHSARCSRLEASKASETETFPNSKRVLFPGKAAVVDRQTTLDPDLQGKMDQWTPQLDLCETKANDKRPIICEVCSVECANGNMYADHLRGKRHRATTLRLEQQLEKAAQPEPKDSRRGGNSSAASASSPATTSTLAKGANSDDAGKGRRASCSDANLQSRSSQRRRDFNQLPRGGEVRSMRQTLEDQQRAATVFMADQGQEATADAAQAMSFLRTPGKSHGLFQQLPPKQSPSSQETGTSPVYSLADFIAPGTKESSRRTKGREKVGRVWGEESKAAAAKPPSFNHILHEESEAKKHFDEYGDNAWFVSGKPRSTSFEGIVAAQRREEREAEREAEEENLRQIEENMLILVMEMSKNDGNAPPVPSHAQGKGGRKGRGRKDAQTPRNRGGRGRRAKQNSGADQPADARNVGGSVS